MRSALPIIVLIVASGCTSGNAAVFQRDSTVHFKVIDFDGNPISNATVRVNTMKNWVPGENFGRTVYMNVYGETDTNGESSVSFLCKSMNFTYGARANGYYGDGGGVAFARAGSGFTLRQTQFETNVVVRLKPIVKPDDLRHYQRVILALRRTRETMDSLSNLPHGELSTAP